MQLSKPVHGLREACLHEFLQTVSYIFWNEKLLSKKPNWEHSFLRPMYLKNRKTKSMCCNSWIPVCSFLHMEPLFSVASFPVIHSSMRWDTFCSEVSFYFPHFLFYQDFVPVTVVQFELEHCHLDICNWKKLLVLKFKHITHSLVTLLETVQCFAFRGTNVELYIFIR